MKSTSATFKISPRCTNTNGHVFSLSNTQADDRVAFAICKMLHRNQFIRNLNIESNFCPVRASCPCWQHCSTTGPWWSFASTTRGTSVAGRWRKHHSAQARISFPPARAEDDDNQYPDAQPRLALTEDTSESVRGFRTKF